MIYFQDTLHRRVPKNQFLKIIFSTALGKK